MVPKTGLVELPGTRTAQRSSGSFKGLDKAWATPENSGALGEFGKVSRNVHTFGVISGNEDEIETGGMESLHGSLARGKLGEA